MPHFPHTPEALLGRNDSKNPTSTCRGITSSGRACRRALASPKTSPAARPIPEAALSNGASSPASYCWQHKDQAVELADAEAGPQQPRHRSKSKSKDLYPLRERSSIDTLVQKLGIHGRHHQGPRKQNGSAHVRTAPRGTSANDSAGPAPTSQAPHAEKYASRPSGHAPPKRKQGFWASLCCMIIEEEDYVEIVRHRRRTEQMQQVSAATSIPSDPRPLRHQPLNGETNNILSRIPHGLPPQTTSALLSELVKPISPYDEDGYIYIFWLTPQSRTPPPDSLARSLLQSRSGRPQNSRTVSDVMTEYSFDEADESSRHEQRPRKYPRNKTITLKIGRANNITRRMNEWQRQCGYALNLVRWYPYVPSSGTPSPPQSASLYPDLSQDGGTGVHKCPHIHRVERLIHIELASKQVKRQCAACGKEHREWFEVPATQVGVKAVDEVVRRWIGWAERQPGSSRKNTTPD